VTISSLSLIPDEGRWRKKLAYFRQRGGGPKEGEKTASGDAKNQATARWWSSERRPRRKKVKKKGESTPLITAKEKGVDMRRLNANAKKKMSRKEVSGSRWGEKTIKRNRIDVERTPQ